MKDDWSWCNEVLQNLVIAGISAVWLSMIYFGRDVPQSLDIAFGAVMIFLGFKSYKSCK